jgi:hypothetical protein
VKQRFVYLEAVDYAFGGFVDYSQLIKITAATPKRRNATAPQRASAAKRNASLAIPIRSHEVVRSARITRPNGPARNYFVSAAIAGVTFFCFA